MTTCPLCLSSIPAKMSTCPFCGAETGTEIHELTAKVAAKEFQSASRALKKAPEGLDMKRARGLLKKGLRALEEGDLMAASMTSQALTGALRLAESYSKRPSRKGGDGGNTKSLLSRAAKKIKYARERGAGVAKAQKFLVAARRAVGEGEVGRARELASMAMKSAEDARRHAWGSQLISGAEKALETAEKRGGQVEEGLKLIAKAKDALESGIYGEVQRWTKSARELADRARRTRVGEDAIQRVEKLLEVEAAEGSDLSAAVPHLEDAWTALNEGRFSAVTRELQRCRRITNEASRLRKSTESLDILRGEIAELEPMKAETSRAKELLAKAEKALKGTDWKGLRASFNAATREVKRARTERERELILYTVEKLVEKAGKGDISALGARELLTEVEKALGQGRHADIDTIVEAKFEAEATKQENIILRGIGDLRGLLSELRVAGIEVSGASGLLEKAEEALEARKFNQAQGLLGKAREASESLREALQASALRYVEELDAELGGLKEIPLQAPDAEEFLKRSREAMERGDTFKAADLARLGLQACHDTKKRRRKDIAPSEDREGLEKLTGQLTRVWGMLDDLAKAGIDIGESKGKLQEATKALGEDMTRAAALLAELEESATNVHGGLVSAARDLIVSARLKQSRAAKHWEEIPEAEELLKNAEAKFEEGRYDEVIELAKISERKARSRMERFIKEAEAEVASRARNIRRRLDYLRRQMRDLTRAEIAIEGSDEDLLRAEEALDEGDFEAAEEYIAAVEDLARVLASGLETAAQDLLQRAEGDVQTALQEGHDVQRGEAVLLTAHEGLEDQRFVEVLEYCKVIQDILKDVREKSTLKDLAGYLESTQGHLQDLESRGLKMSRTERLLDDAHEAMARGDVERARIIVDCLRNPLEDLRASDASQVQEAEDIASQMEEARGFLSEAQSIIETGEPGELRELLAKAQFRLGGGSEAARASLEEVQELVGLAEALGVEVSQQKKALKRMESSLQEDPDTALQSLRDLRKSIMCAVQDTVEDPRPLLVVELPEAELQEGRWTPTTLRIRNEGKVPAQRVRLGLKGDVEVRGLETLARLGPGEDVAIEVRMKPLSQGKLPVGLGLLYRGLFDEEEALSTSEGYLRASPTGSYVVEDVFLVHSDGRLICHQSTKTMDEIDEDIFSGMLTVVQDFVKDSFRKRTRVGLKRLEFAESKIIIERGAYVYLATVMIGGEPELLPLYMAEVINEIERTYGDRLETWTGLLSELEGVDEIVRKLLFLTMDETIRGPEGTESAMSSAMSLIRGGKALGLHLEEAEQLLEEAKEEVGRHPDRAWALIEDAVGKALKSQQDLQSRLKGLLEVLETDLEGLTRLGLEGTGDLGDKYQESRDDVERAKRALARGEYDVAARMVTSLETSVTALKERVVSERIEKELSRLDKALHDLKGEGGQTEKALQTLDRARVALASGKLGDVNDQLEAADAMARELRESFLLKKYEDEFGELRGVLEELSRRKNAPSGVDQILAQASDAMKRNDVEELGHIIAETRRSILEGQAGQGKEPRLFLRTPKIPMGMGAWNLLPIEIVNKGDWAAQGVQVDVKADADVKGEFKLGRLEPGVSYPLQIGVYPRGEGTLTIELEVSYTKYLGEEHYALRGMEEAEVLSEAVYPVEDLLLYLPTGELIAHDSRAYRDKEAEVKFYESLQPLQQRIAGAKGERELIHWEDYEGGRATLARGEKVCLVAVSRKKEPDLLPLYMLQALRDLESIFGEKLEAWEGDREIREDLRKAIRGLHFVTDTPAVELGPLAASPITSRLFYGTSPDSRPTRVKESLQEIQKGFGEGGFGRVMQVLDSLLGRPPEGSEGRGPPTKEGAVSLEVDDATIRDHIEVVKEIDRAVTKARGKAGLETHWPVEKIAIRAMNPMIANAATSFRAIIMNHANAKEVDILQRGEFWKGAELRMQIQQEAIAKAYKGSARKIELILKSQDPWKIKAGIDRGGYEMGIEGQILRIFPNMVSFQLVMPPHVVVQQFQGGLVFLDTTLTEETRAEGYANEIVKIVLEARKELRVEDPKPVTVNVAASPRLRSLLSGLEDYIKTEAHVSEIHFADSIGEEDYVLECDVKGEAFTLAIKKV